MYRLKSFLVAAGRAQEVPGARCPVPGSVGTVPVGPGTGHRAPGTIPPGAGHFLSKVVAVLAVLCAASAAGAYAAEAEAPAPAGNSGAPELVLNIDHVGEISALAVAPDSKLIASGSRDRTVKLWDAASGKLLRTLTGHREAVVSVTFAADGATLYSGSRDGTVKAWAVQTGRLVATFKGSDLAPADGAVTAIAEIGRAHV